MEQSINNTGRDRPQSYQRQKGVWLLPQSAAFGLSEDPHSANSFFSRRVPSSPAAFSPWKPEKAALAWALWASSQSGLAPLGAPLLPSLSLPHWSNPTLHGRFFLFLDRIYTAGFSLTADTPRRRPAPPTWLRPPQLPCNLT